MAELKKYRYPVDTASFATIREQGKVYVDKTDLVYDMVYMYTYVFLSRPRRFGKSLLCNTLHAYFDGRKDLFEGLKIMDLEQDWKTYPVFHLTMSGLKNVTIPEAKSKLENLLADYEVLYGRKPEEQTPGDRFRGLIRRAYQQTGERVVVILDEYDAPIMRLLHKPELEDMRGMLREFYQVLKDEGEYIRFVFMTGVTKFSQLSIFSELNNLKNISTLDEFSGICGITWTELDTTLRPCVEQLAGRLSITTDEAYAELKRRYDGYHFSKNSQDVYAPFSVLNALNDGQFNNYWFETGTMTSLLEYLQHYDLKNVLSLDGYEAEISEFSCPCENAATPIPLLYQSGYLSIDTYDPVLQTYVLHFPNQEVRQGLISGLMPSVVGRRQDETDT